MSQRRVSDTRGMRWPYPIVLIVLGLMLAGNTAEASLRGQRCQALFENRLTKLAHGEYQAYHSISGRWFQVYGEMTFRRSEKQDRAIGALVGDIKITTPGRNGGEDDVGAVDVLYFPRVKMLSVQRTFIEPGFERNGLTTLAMEAALKRFSDAKRVNGRLILDNAAAFKEAYEKSEADTHEGRMLEAFRATPFYRSLSVHGFSGIDLKTSYYRPKTSRPSDQLFIELYRP